MFTPPQNPQDYRNTFSSWLAKDPKAKEMWVKYHTLRTKLDASVYRKGPVMTPDEFASYNELVSWFHHQGVRMLCTCTFPVNV